MYYKYFKIIYYRYFYIIEEVDINSDTLQTLVSLYAVVHSFFFLHLFRSYNVIIKFISGTHSFILLFCSYNVVRKGDYRTLPYPILV